MLLAPLSGYTDLAFRRQCRLYGCRFAFTPLIDAGAVVYRDPESDPNLIRGSDEPWLGLQILGAEPDLIGKAICRLQARQFEVVDFNMGCPVPKITKRGAGSALSGNQDRACRCLDKIRRYSSWPVTAKIRILDEINPEPTVKFALKLEQTGIRALTIHGRLPERLYSGPTAAGIIAVVRQSLSIPVIANGGVKDVSSAECLRRDSGCSRIMVARGAIGNPWIFRELNDATNKGKPDHYEICRALYDHVQDMIRLYGEDAGLRNGRKIILAYLVGRGYPRKRRNEVGQISKREEFEEFHRAISLESPG